MTMPSTKELLAGVAKGDNVAIGQAFGRLAFFHDMAMEADATALRAALKKQGEALPW